VPATRGSAARVMVIWTTVIVTGVASAAVFIGGTAAWLLERDVPGRTFNSWGDTVWWALTTLTTVGYGDHVPVTSGGRFIAAAVMIVGVAVIGGVAAGVALAVAQAAVVAEEETLEAEAESIERRLEARLDGLDARMARIEAQLNALQHTALGLQAEWERPRR
jgi:voltage-gated potassium channel Kch